MYSKHWACRLTDSSSPAAEDREMSTMSVLARRLGATGGVGNLILARPKALNALTLDMCRDVNRALSGWLADASLRCILLEGEGGRAFCAGGDVKTVALEGGEFVPGKPGTLRADFFREEYIHDYALGRLVQENSPIAQVSLWDGVVMGGGVGLSAHGAYRVATENTLWAMPESAIGLFPDVGASHILSRLPGGLGLYIALLGARLSASDLIYAGIATHFVPSAALHALKEDIIASDGLDILQVLDSSAKPETGLDSSLCRHRMDIEECFAGKTSMLAIAEALEKNGSEWALQSLASLRKLCPMSLCVTVQQMKRGRDLSLMDCFIMEYRMSQRAVGRHDFVDGVRAMLIDKDGSPTWQPATWEGVEELDVQSFFEPLGQYDWRPQY